MKYIPVGHKHYALIDDEDFEVIGQMGWHMRGEYAVHSKYRYPANPGTLSMHKLILDSPEGMKVDHINGNCLDNRRANLRVATHSQNMMNRRTNTNTKSGLKGVTFDSRYGCWQARIGINGKRITLGSFKTKEEAGIAYALAAEKLQGEFMHNDSAKLLEEV